MNKENLQNLGNHNPIKEPIIEPIENYKGKSVQELEAILDQYNNSRKPTQSDKIPEQIPTTTTDKPPAPLPKR